MSWFFVSLDLVNILFHSSFPVTCSEMARFSYAVSFAGRNVASLALVKWNPRKDRAFAILVKFFVSLLDVSYDFAFVLIIWISPIAFIKLVSL